MASDGGGAYPVMFSPLAIRGVVLRNRIVFQPHFTALGHPDGTPSDAHVAYHEERARGGVGHIVKECHAGPSDRQDVAQVHQRLGPGGHPGVA